MADKYRKDGTDGCIRTITRETDVRLPLNVSAHASLKEVRTKCCGEPEVQIIGQCCECRVIVKQKLAVSIAIEYGTDVIAEDCVAECSAPVGV